MLVDFVLSFLFFFFCGPGWTVSHRIMVLLMDFQQQDATVPGHMDPGMLTCRNLLPLTQLEAGRKLREVKDTTPSHARLLDKLLISGRQSSTVLGDQILEERETGRETGITNGKWSTKTGTNNTIKTMRAKSLHHIIEKRAETRRREPPWFQNLTSPRREKKEVLNETKVFSFRILAPLPPQGLSQVKKS